MTSTKKLLLSLLAGLGLVAGPGAAAPAPEEITSLESSLAPLTEHFDRQRGKPRFVALLSPT